ncbi:transmembrane regulator PrtR [Pyxidicoccus sp. QH1ED-7-1]|nr:transmembrane regulator PrtR [Pyxidicoccus xibeiensis]
MQQALRRAARHSVQGMRAPASLRAGIQMGLHREQRRAQYGVWLRAGAMALVVVTVGGGWVAYQSEQRERSARREVVKHHSKIVGMPFDFDAKDSSPEQMAEWVQSKVDRRVTLPQLPNAKPLGGRLSILNGREVAYISYETLPRHEGEPGRRLGVFVLPDGEPGPSVQPLEAVEVAPTEGFNVVTWRDAKDEIVYEMVTDMDEDDIRRMLAARDSGATLAQKQPPVETEEPLFSHPPASRPQQSRPFSVAPATYSR